MFHGYFSRPLFLYLCFPLIANLVAQERRQLFSQGQMHEYNQFGGGGEGQERKKKKFHVTPTQKISVLLSKMGERGTGIMIKQKIPLEENTEYFICCELKHFLNVF